MASDNKRKLCIVPACKGLRFDLAHKFPMREDRAEIWRTTLNISGRDMDDLRKRSFVCSRHFLPCDYKNAQSRSLNWNAVPKINLSRYDNPMGLDSSITPHPRVGFTPPVPETPPQRTNTVAPESPVRKLKKVEEKDKQIAIPTGTPSKLLTKVHVLTRSSPNRLQKKAPEIKPQNNAKRRAKPTIKDKLAEVRIATKQFNSLIKTMFTAIDPAVQPSADEQPQPMERGIIPPEEQPQVCTMTESALIVPGLETPLDYFWLRDHCRCDKCYNYATNQRRLAIRDISLNIRPANAAGVNGDQININWPDGHSSEYSIETLRTLLNRQVTAKAITWNRDTIQRFSYARVSMTEYLTDPQVSRRVVQSLVDYGVAFVEKVPPNAKFTEIVIKHLFAVHRTHFGEIWTFTDSNVGFLDTAFTSEALMAHTDNTYFNDASGLQVLHCIEYDATGGQSLLVDGFRVLEQLKASRPEVYERLKRYQVPAENKDKESHHTHTAPIIIEDPEDGSPQQIRYNIADRAPMTTLPMSEMRQFYEDLQVMAREVEDPANEWWFSLKPGTVMFFNNWRLLHGRSAFKGTRVMSGGYVSRAEFMSVARSLKVVP